MSYSREVVNCFYSRRTQMLSRNSKILCSGHKSSPLDTILSSRFSALQFYAVLTSVYNHPPWKHSIGVPSRHFPHVFDYVFIHDFHFFFVCVDHPNKTRVRVQIATLFLNPSLLSSVSQTPLFSPLPVCILSLGGHTYSHRRKTAPTL